MTAIFYYYDKEANPGEALGFPGVPLDDLTEEMFKAQPAHMQKSIAASNLYKKTKPKNWKPKEEPKPKAQPASVETPEPEPEPTEDAPE